MGIIDGKIVRTEQKNAFITGANSEIAQIIQDKLQLQQYQITSIKGRSDYNLANIENTNQVLDKIISDKKFSLFIHLASPLPQQEGYFTDPSFYNVNVDAFVKICNKILPSMIQNRRGCIIAFGSQLAISPNSDDLGIEYNIAKAGLLNYCLHLAKKYQNTGVRILYFAPSIIDTSYHKENKLPKIPISKLAEIILESCGDEIKFPNGSIVSISGKLPDVSVNKLILMPIHSSGQSLNSNTSLPLRDKLSSLFQSVFLSLQNTDSAEIENSALGHTSDWDSLKHIKLILEVEHNFEISIPSTELQKLNSYKKILEFLSNEKY